MKYYESFFFEMEISKLSNFLVDMCQSSQGTMVLYFEIYSMNKILTKNMHERWGQMIDYPFVNIIMFRECIQKKIVTWQIWKKKPWLH